MVGFGSSLRMSRRRGWEDAYLDYQSLRLLLTQIEAVYEEEDWHRGGGGGGEQSGGDGGDFDAAASEESSEDKIGWKSLMGNAWHMTMAVVTGKRYHRYNSIKRRRSMRRYPRVVSSGTNLTWPAEGGRGGGEDDYFDYSNSPTPPGRRRSKLKKNKSDGQTYNRALDRGGWRSPGTADYRDELFLVSDEEIAYGYCEDEDGNADEDDEDEWEDESECQQCYDNEVRSYDISVEEYAGLNVEEGFPPIDNDDDVEHLRSDSKLTPGSEKSDKSEQRLKSHVAIQENRKLQTSISQESPPNQKTSQKVKFSDSPGVLEAGYETFAVAAARRGDDSQMMYVGSPSEQEGGWLDFIPNLLSKGKQKEEAQTSTESDPLLQKGLSQQGDLNDDDIFDTSPLPVANLSSSFDVMDNTPHTYTHFSDIPAPPLLEEEGTPSRLAYALNDNAELTSPYHMKSIDTPPTRSPEKSARVEATAVGNMLPMTPPPIMTPNEAPTSGGFGVSLKMIPTEPSGLLHPSSPRKTSIDSDFVQFYSFKNEEDDFNSAAHNQLGTIGQGAEYDGGDEDEHVRTSTSNMISYYSGGGKDGYFAYQSPTRAAAGSRRHHHPHHQQLSANLQQNTQRSPIRQQKSSMSENSRGGNNFIMNFLFGNAGGSAGVTRTASNRSGLTATSRNSHRGDGSAALHEQHRHQHGSATMRQKHRSAAAARRKRVRLRKQRRLKRQRERIPEHLRVAHARAAAITERFRGLLVSLLEPFWLTKLLIPAVFSHCITTNFIFSLGGSPL